ncbi:SRX-2 protein [Aphelenchoides avenae]|nr:SRX-2 protein [Aphelenchus avenae]
MQWYQCVITEVIMALDRLVVVVYPQWDFLFSRRNVIIVSACIFPVALILALIADLVFPCCTVYVYHGVFGYSYFGEGTNYANQIFDVPMNFSSSAIALTCYAVIFVYVRRSNRIAVGTIDQQSAIRRKKKEVRYALQFGLLSLFVLCAWMSFRIFPLIVPPEIPELYVLITMCVVVHCSSNSFIYLTMNSEFKKQFAAQFTGRRLATMTASTSFGSGAKGPHSSGPNNSHAAPNDA